MHSSENVMSALSFKSSITNIHTWNGWVNFLHSKLETLQLLAMHASLNYTIFDRHSAKRKIFELYSFEEYCTHLEAYSHLMRILRLNISINFFSFICINDDEIKCHQEENETLYTNHIYLSKDEVYLSKSFPISFFFSFLGAIQIFLLCICGESIWSIFLNL